MAPRKTAPKKSAAAPQDESIQAATEDQQHGTDLAELTPEQRAQHMLKSEKTAAALIALAKQSANILTITNDDGLAEAIARKKTLTTARTTIEKTGKAARDDANKYQKAVIAEENKLIAHIRPEETRLSELIDAENLRRAEAARAAKEEEERKAEIIRKAFDAIREMRNVHPDTTVEAIDNLIVQVMKSHDIQVQDLPQDLHAAAKYEYSVTINALRAARDKRQQADKDAKELAEFRAFKAKQEAEAQAQAAASTPAPDADDADDDLPPGADTVDVAEPVDILDQHHLPPVSETVEVRRVATYGGHFVAAPQQPVNVRGNLNQPLASQPKHDLLHCAREALALMKDKGLTGYREYSLLQMAVDAAELP